MKRYAYYPGCLAEKAEKELDIATRKVCERLGIELVDFEEFCCCGAGTLTEKNFELSIALNARNFAIAERQGLDIMTACGTCLLVMNEARTHLDDNARLLEKMSRILEECGLKYNGETKIHHLFFILNDYVDLEKYVTTPLNSSNIAPFYGCQLLRPSEYLGYDDPENPNSFEKLIKRLGGHPIAYESRKKCCGFHAFATNEATTLKLAGNILKDAKLNNADCLVTTGPCCHTVLDGCQLKIERVVHTRLGIPVLHLAQLVGIAMGIGKKELGMRRHIVSTKKFVKKLEA